MGPTTFVHLLLSRQCYLSFKERLMDFLNSQDDKQPLIGDCRNSEDDDKCF